MKILKTLFVTILLGVAGLVESQAQPTGAINGLFSIAEGQYVCFSKGNLQFQASTSTWRFADNQYDIVGSGNSNISQTYSGWIDLFGWGTSGFNHNWACYQPWSTSTNEADYYAYGIDTCNLFDSTGQADWGFNRISNGGNLNGMWRTLTSDEWNYILHSRVTNSGIRFTMATVNGVCGLLLLPDSWSSDLYLLKKTNQYAHNTNVFDANIISLSDWINVLEAHGAVFLPIGGKRTGSSYYGGEGFYWASDIRKALWFYHNASGSWVGVTSTAIGRPLGLTVRLVNMPSQSSIYSVATGANISTGGKITGAGKYMYGAQCTLHATPNGHYTFVRWTKNGSQVSTSPTFSFTVTESATYVAEFAVPSGGAGQLNGTFSVNNNVQVNFSQGNLQYQASTNTWRFAINQYECIGVENENASQLYSGWIDLFGWGTSGYNHGAVCYQPYSISSNNSDYYAYGQSGYNLFDQSGEADWGYNAISNGGNSENSGWRTLTYQEWNYLLNTRATVSGIRYAKAKVNGVCGVILLPDDWDESLFSLDYTNNSDVDFFRNIVSDDEWVNIFEYFGAVFLPAAGRMASGSFTDLNDIYPDVYGCYWSSSKYDFNSDYAVRFYFRGVCDQGVGGQLNYGNLSVNSAAARSMGCSVRLARISQNYSYLISASPSQKECGTVSGSGLFLPGQTCTLTAVSNPGYTFVNWTENGNIVSADATYSFMVTEHRILKANYSSVGNYVDLGLPSGTMWALCNVGAVLPADLGNTFAWGATTPNVTGWDNYLYCNGTDHTLTKYCYNADYGYNGFTDNLNVLLLEDDAAAANWGPAWRMPSSEEWQELFNNTTSKMVVQDNYEVGWLFTASNGNSIYIPCQSDMYQTSCWSSSLGMENPSEAVGFNFFEFNMSPSSNNISRSAGCFVRPVRSGFSNNSIITAFSAPLEGGTVLGAGAYDYGTTCTLAALPHTGYTFVNWTENGEIVSLEPSYGFTVTVNRTLVANFAMSSFHISVSSNPAEGGTVTGAGSYNNGSTCTLTATPNEGYAFVNWTENGEVVSWDDAYSFTVSGDRNLVANFIQALPYLVDDFDDGVIDTLLWPSPANGEESDGWMKIITNEGGGLSTNFIVVPESGTIVIEGVFKNTFTGLGSPYDGYYLYFNGDEQSYIRLENYDGGLSLKTQLNGMSSEVYLCDLAIKKTHKEVVQIDVLSGTLSYCVDNRLITTVEVPGLTDLPASYFKVMFYGGVRVYTMNYIKINANEPDCNIAASANPSSEGSVSGAGTYGYGEICTLTAAANSGYCFMYWTENGQQVSPDASYSFIVTEDRELVANFCAPLTIATSSNPVEGGTVTGAGVFDYGNTCTLTAIANPGYTFIKWTKNGEDVSYLSPFTFSVTENADYVAVFEETDGIVIGAPEGTNVYLPSYSFYEYALSQQIYTHDEIGGSTTVTGISLFNTGGQKTRNYDIYLVHTDKAAFSSNTDWITVTESDRVFSGDVTMMSGCWTTIEFDTPFAYNGTSNLAIVVDDNSGNYTGSPHMACRVFNTQGTQAIRVYSISTNYDPYNPSGYGGTLHSVKNQIILNMAPITYEINTTATPSNGGTVSGGGSYSNGSTCTLTASANSGYVFSNWTENGQVVSTEVSYSFTVTGNRSLVANFAEEVPICNIVFDLYDSYGDGYTGNYLVVSYGDVTEQYTIESGSYASYSLDIVTGSVVSLSWIKGSYIEDCSFNIKFENGVPIYHGSNLSATFQEDVAIDCELATAPYLISATANPTEGGDVEGDGVYEGGSSCTLHAIPNSGYTFMYWTENGQQVSTDATYSFAVIGNRDLVAHFSLPLSITASSNPSEGGSVTGSGSYNYGATCTLMATANTGYTFMYWTENGIQVSSNATYSFTVAGNRNLVAHFSRPLTIAASSNPSEGGSITGPGLCDYGTTCTLTATANPGYTFIKWTKNGEDVSYLSSFTFSVTENADYVAVFEETAGIVIGVPEGANVYLPSYSFYEYALSQQIYTHDEIGGSTTVTGISLFNTGGQKTRNYDIYLVHTDKAAFSSNTDWITVTESDRVFSGDVTMISGCWMTIEFDTPFAYNGTSNLAIVIDDNSGNYTWSPHMACRVFNTQGTQAIRVYSVSTNYDPYNPSGYGGTLHSEKNQIVLQTSLTQTVQLSSGWNWFSTYLSGEPTELLQMLENSLGENGIVIKSNAVSTDYYEDYGWYGDLDDEGLKSSQMYMIKTNAACTVELEGVPANPAEVGITIRHGWNWIGFPCAEAMSVADALAGFQAEDGDILKSSGASTDYYEGFGWYGELETMEPGEGFMYYSNSQTTKTVYFQTGSKKDKKSIGNRNH